MVVKFAVLFFFWNRHSPQLINVDAHGGGIVVNVNFVVVLHRLGDLVGSALTMMASDVAFDIRRSGDCHGLSAGQGEK